MRCARQTVRKWRAQHLLEREPFTNTDDRKQYAPESNDKKLK
jgi:hypothetical protein